MKLFVDDERKAPIGWQVARNINGAIRAIEQMGHIITDISLDHDNGLHDESFQAVARYIVLFYKDSQTQPTITIHSANPVGRDKLLSIFRSNLSAYPIDYNTLLA